MKITKNKLKNSRSRSSRVSNLKKAKHLEALKMLVEFGLASEDEIQEYRKATESIQENFGVSLTSFCKSSRIFSRDMTV